MVSERGAETRRGKPGRAQAPPSRRCCGSGKTA